MIIVSKINGNERNLLQTSPLKEVFIANPNLTLLEAFQIMNVAKGNEPTEASSVLEVKQENVSTGPLPYEAPKEEKISMEEAPVQTEMGTISGPNIEEINKLRGAISTASDRLLKLADQIDELNQMLQVTLDSGKTLDEPSIKM